MLLWRTMLGRGAALGPLAAGHLAALWAACLGLAKLCGGRAVFLVCETCCGLTNGVLQPVPWGSVRGWLLCQQRWDLPRGCCEVVWVVLWAAWLPCVSGAGE